MSGQAAAPEPVRRYTARLTSADALVWETLPRDGRRRDLVLLIAIAAIAGLGLGMLPESWTEGWRFYAAGLCFGALGYGCWVGIRRLDAQLRAHRRIPRPVETAVAEWGDHFEIAEAGRSRFIAFETIGAVVATPAHLFVASGSDLIILPVAAFESEADMRASAEALEARLREPD
jgi:hypothetical protein